MVWLAGWSPEMARARRYRAALLNLLYTVLIVAGTWTLSSLGYFQLEPMLQAEIGYNDAPISFAVYYAFWAVRVLVIFRQSFPRAGDLSVTPVRLGVMALMLTAFAIFAMGVLPRLPQMEWTRTQSPVEFFWANSWYFLPKTVEILFQQILIAALVFALARLRLRTRTISLLVAGMFGAFHLTLALSYPNPVYVLRYSVAAALFGALVPWVLINLRHGFLITFGIHWAYYALDAIAIHFVFASS